MQRSKSAIQQMKPGIEKCTVQSLKLLLANLKGKLSTA